MKTTLFTLKALNALLVDEDLPAHNGRPLTKDNCETYGRQTMAYIHCGNMVQRARVEQKLRAAGGVVSRTYCTRLGNCPTDTPNIEVRVSYLRARGWNE